MICPAIPPHSLADEQHPPDKKQVWSIVKSPDHAPFSILLSWSSIMYTAALGTSPTTGTPHMDAGGKCLWDMNERWRRHYDHAGSGSRPAYFNHVTQAVDVLRQELVDISSGSTPTQS